MRPWTTINRYWLAPLLLVMLAIGGCGDTGPAAAARDFVDAALDKDCAGMVKLSSSESLGGQSREDATRECESSEGLTGILGLLDNVELEDFETLEEDIGVRGDTATVRARLTVKAGDREESLEPTFKLVLEDEAWRVDF